MGRLFSLVLLFGVIHCQLDPTVYNRPLRHGTKLHDNGLQSMVWISCPGTKSDEDDSKEDFDDVFTEVVDLFKEVDVDKSKLGLDDYNAVDLYTPEGYKRIYPFENCNQNSVDVEIKHRVMKVRALCSRKLKDIVVLPHNLQTQLLTYHVDSKKSKLIITIPFVKNSVYFDTDKFC